MEKADYHNKDKLGDIMDKIFEVLRMESCGEIILIDDEFNRFINEMKLPIFRKRFESNSFKHETLFTIFNGKIIRGFERVTKK